jgi:hypothetical protein
LPPGCGVPIAEIVRSETAETEVGARLKSHIVDLLGWEREILKMGLTVLARIYSYDHARAPYPQRDYHARKGVFRVTLNRFGLAGFASA